MPDPDFRLSPAAQAVLDAFWEHPPGPLGQGRDALAAALRAVAAPLEHYDPPRNVNNPEDEQFVDGKCVRNSDIYAEIIALATELENHG
jgi:hypothetical protein